MSDPPSSPDSLDGFATAALGLTGQLVRELTTCGAQEIHETRGGVAFSGPLEVGYRVCLWSRVASRILCRLSTFPAPDGDALYAGARKVPWSDHVAPTSTVAVHATARHSPIRHTGFAALKVKDALVDEIREQTGTRPDVRLRQPDVAVYVHLEGGWATVFIDLSGEGLHRRGYRAPGGEAPLKENLAAAMLYLLDWPAVAERGGAFIDPMCGSGTLPIEAALMAGDVAPGRFRSYFGFLGWRRHDAALWARLLAEAEGRATAGLARLPTLVGYDADAGAVASALAAVDRAGLRGKVHVERRELSEVKAPPRAEPGLLAVNPPYGERLGVQAELKLLYAGIGALLRGPLGAWRGGILTGSPVLGEAMGLEALGRVGLFNGALPVELWKIAPHRRVARDAPPDPAAPALVEAEVTGAFADRLRKRAKHLGKWAEREGVSCYRVYDADIPEYSVAVDVYEGYVHVQEYAPPRDISPAAAAAHLAEVQAAIPSVLGVPPDHVFFKTRQRQRGRAQYGKLAERGELQVVHEAGLKILVNLSDYLDTGLFLDHRLVRELIGRLAPGTRFLNLYAYTATATLHAIRGGARTTTTVDLSPTYLGWARRNLALNGWDHPVHELVRADCLTFVREERRQWDLIFLDPPTFSNARKAPEVLDIQRDHVELVRACLMRLAPRGTLIFSTNHKRFKLDEAALAGLEIENLEHATLPEDFQRSPRIHQVWQIRGASPTPARTSAPPAPRSGPPSAAGRSRPHRP